MKPHLPRPFCRLALSGFIASSLLVASGGAGLGQEEVEASYPPSPKGHDWLEFYYKEPTPEFFVGQVRNWDAAGILGEEDARGALIGFLSSVIRDNPEKTVEWHDALRNLSTDGQNTLRLSMWFANTGETKAVLNEYYGGDFDADKEPPKVLEMQLTLPPALNLLWGTYYATGDDKVIRRIMTAFDYAGKQQSYSSIPEDETPFYTVLPSAARWSLASNAKKHPKVAEQLETVYAQEDSGLSSTQQQWLYDTLSDINPEKYPPKEDPEEEGDTGTGGADVEPAAE